MRVCTLSPRAGADAGADADRYGNKGSVGLENQQIIKGGEDISRAKWYVDTCCIPAPFCAMGENPTLCTSSPLCRDGIAVVNFTNSRKRHATFLLYGF